MRQDRIGAGSGFGFVDVDLQDYPIPRSHIIKNKYFFNICHISLLVHLKSIWSTTYEKYRVESFVLLSFEALICKFRIAIHLKPSGTGLGVADLKPSGQVQVKYLFNPYLQVSQHTIQQKGRPKYQNTLSTD